MTILDYAKEKVDKEYLTYYDIYSVLLCDLDCIVARESASDLLGYSNGGDREKIYVYSIEKIDLPYIECTVLPNYKKIKIDDYHNLKITPINEAIIDMLKNESDDQILMETLSNYYYENNCSYEGIDVPKSLKKKFDFYSEEGKRYYDTV